MVLPVSRRASAFALTSVFLCSTAFAVTYPNRIWQVGATDATDIEAAYLSSTESTVSVKKSDGTTVLLSFADISDEDLRYVKNVAGVALPYRTWSRTFRTENGQLKSERFSAAVVDVTGFDSPLSKRHVVVVRLDNGSRRGYALQDLSAADRTYVASVEASFPAPKAPNDGAKYLPNYTPYTPGVTPDPFNYYVTDHFVFYWGNSFQGEGTNWGDANFRAMNFAYFEQVWNYFNSISATLPYWNKSVKYKTNVYVTNTGLKYHPDGFAFAANDIIISPTAMLAGSSVIPHEFGHVLQFHSGGNRDSAYVGWFWENHANWCSSRFIPSLTPALDVYAQRGHYELDSSRMNYGSWPFVEYFASHPKFTPSIAFDVWRAAKRNAAGAATETPLEAFTRLGVARGVFTGTGVTGFGDMIGQMAAHNATWDYTYQQGFSDDLIWAKNHGAPWRGQTILRPVPDRAGYYRPMHSQAPRQYGFNVIDLDITSGATEVVANFDGLVDEGLYSNWRLQFVAINSAGQARYSRMWRTGEGRMKLKAGERLKLAIAATPDRTIRTDFRPGYNKQKRHFLYEVAFTNCTPSTKVLGVRTVTGIAGHKHSNGGGFVANSASVDATAYVGPQAFVLDWAQVRGKAKIMDRAVIGGAATVADSAIVSGNAYVFESASVRENAKVSDYAVLWAASTVKGNARVREAINVAGDGVVEGDAMVKGFGDLYTSRNLPLGGGAIVGQDSEIYLGAWSNPIKFGTLYGFMATDQLRDEVVDNKYLYAHWDFLTPKKRLVYDALTDNDGVLRGNAKFSVVDGTRRVLSLAGDGGYAAFEGHAIDSAGVTFDAQLRWRGGVAEQRLFSFGSDKGSISFTPSDSTGKAALIVKRGSTTQILRASRALPLNVWSRVTVTYDGVRGQIFFDGVLVGTSSTFSIPLSDIPTTAGYLGRDVVGGPTLFAALYDVAIYRKAFANFADLQPPYTR